MLQLCDSHIITESEFPQWKGLGNCLQPPLQDYQKAELQQRYHGALWVTERVCGKGWFFALRPPLTPVSWRECLCSPPPLCSPGDRLRFYSYHLTMLTPWLTTLWSLGVLPTSELGKAGLYPEWNGQRAPSRHPFPTEGPHSLIVHLWATLTSAMTQLQILSPWWTCPTYHFQPQWRPNTDQILVKQMLTWIKRTTFFSSPRFYFFYLSCLLFLLQKLIITVERKTQSHTGKTRAGYLHKGKIQKDSPSAAGFTSEMKSSEEANPCSLRRNLTLPLKWLPWNTLRQALLSPTPLSSESRGGQMFPQLPFFGLFRHFRPLFIYPYYP